jgi:two-component system, cell cycle sensor histidine kinase and response regulator CckA
VEPLIGAAVASLTTDAICVFDAELKRFVEVNLAFTQVFGYTPAEARLLRLGDFSVSEPSSTEALMAELDAAGRVDAGVRLYRCKDGNVVAMATRSSIAVVDGRRFYCSVMRDLTEITTAQRAAVDSDQRFRTLADAAFEGICITEGGLIVDCNEQLGRLFGVPAADLIGRRAVDFVAPEALPMLAQRYAEGRNDAVEHPMLRADGSRFFGESQAKTLHLGKRTLRVSALRDISARKQIESQLQASLRLESIGRLAGGIAHDFNNLLTVIMTLVELMLERPRPQGEQEDLRQVQGAAVRAAALTQQLLAFARRRIVEPRVVDLNLLLGDLDSMLRRLLGEHITLKVARSEDDLGAVRVDPGQIEQVVVNLAINARDAMASGGTLTLETANVALGPEYTATHPEVSPGQYVLLAVSDTGCGMDAGTIERIFEPFFTTKSERGNGLGLSTCYGIVKQSGGSLWVYSEVGRGTTFKVYLPRVYDELDTLSPSTPPPLRRGTERVLLLEDDPMVRPVAARALREYGYEVYEAANPTEARQIFARLHGKVDALITDVVLPEMNGRQLAELLREEQPGLRVLYTSGYTENTIVHHGVVDAGIHFLAKPYLSTDLAQRVRAVFDQDGHEPKS